MWWFLSYILGAVITALIMGFIGVDLFDNEGAPIFGIMLWPILALLVFVVILFGIPYNIGLWYNKYKNQINLKLYLIQKLKELL